MICDAAQSRIVGYGLDAGVQMGPVINQESRQRIESLIDLGEKDGATVCVDGRKTVINSITKRIVHSPDHIDGC